MEAQEALNEEALDDGQAAQILTDLNDNIENQARSRMQRNAAWETIERAFHRYTAFVAFNTV
jgi:hypothetical protein